jgi:hypothetical protein
MIVWADNDRGLAYASKADYVRAFADYAEGPTLNCCLPSLARAAIAPWPPRRIHGRFHVGLGSIGASVHRERATLFQYHQPSFLQH